MVQVQCHEATIGESQIQLAYLFDKLCSDDKADTGISPIDGRVQGDPEGSPISNSRPNAAL